MKSDMQLRGDVQAELDWDPRFDARDIAVTVKDGVVTLAGKVSSYAERVAAQEAAEKVTGVSAIANEIAVELRESTRRNDAELAADVLEAFRRNIVVPSEQVKAVVSDGWITLDGEVAIWRQKEAAQLAVRNLRGVRGVANNIVVRPPQTTVEDVRAKIEDAFRRHAELDADSIRVSLDQGTLILSGEVHSLRQRNEAEAAAWSSPGVTKVDNRLHVQL